MLRPRPVNRDEESLAAIESAWYEIIDAVMAGRATQLVCPECQKEGLQVTEQGNRITVSCPSCLREVDFENQQY